MKQQIQMYKTAVYTDIIHLLVTYVNIFMPPESWPSGIFVKRYFTKKNVTR